MPSGAIHPNTGNFSRANRLHIVERIRKLVSHNAYEKRPEWLEFVERAPPMELHNLKLRDIRIRSPYPSMVKFVLKQFPDMRFQDCFVDGNDWSRGNDNYRDDHPVMQFVARQLQLMNEGGLSRHAAFEKTRLEYLERRRTIENNLKINMALACNQRIVPAFNNPLFTTAAGVTRSREAELEISHLNHIRRKLRMLRKEIEPHDRRRMSAKEIALDLEVERASLLPRMSVSSWKSLEADVLETPRSDEKDTFPISEDNNTFNEQFEFLPVSEAEQDDSMFEWRGESTAIEPSTSQDRGGRKWKPVDLVGEQVESGLIHSKMTWEPANKVDASSNILVRPMKPIVSVKPSFTHSRPDKKTVQAILVKKAKAEVERRIGKEPGDHEGDMDFEDFMNMLQKKK